MSYDIGVWEQIRSMVQWKTRSLETDISKEISTDNSLRDFHALYPVPWQLKEVLKQRGAYTRSERDIECCPSLATCSDSAVVGCPWCWSGVYRVAHAKSPRYRGRARAGHASHDAKELSG
jgi:hypothetical protein